MVRSILQFVEHDAIARFWLDPYRAFDLQLDAETAGMINGIASLLQMLPGNSSIE